MAQEMDPREAEWIGQNPQYAAMAGRSDPNATGKKNAPPPPDYMGAAERQAQTELQANRPNQTNAFGASVNWTQNPDGSWSQNQSFGGPMGGLFGNLQGQAVNAMGQPMDWSQFGNVGTGDSARNQAIEAAFGQASSRLNPMWDQRESALQTQLINQGLDPNSEAAKNATSQFGRDRNDAYTSALNMAIGQGTAAGDSAFRNNMMADQYRLANALGQRGQAFGELQGMMPFMGQQGFQGFGGTQYLPAAMGLGQYNFNAWDAESSAFGDAMGGLFGGLGSLAGGFGSIFGGRKK